ncbi:MAG: metal-dependent hydrolase, partial [Endomicrobium sp.]|nr:metal-dependent hydrolase [Endomicrobium sp.]
MPNFVCHLGVGAMTSALLVAYGDFTYDFGKTTSTLAFVAGLSGSLIPDLDSDTSKTLKLSGSIVGLGAAALTVGFGTTRGFWGRPWDTLLVCIIAVAAFLLFNTLVVKFLQKFTVHRGLFHSLAVPFLYAGI